jgi:molybdopterin converting factor small subunit
MESDMRIHFYSNLRAIAGREAFDFYSIDDRVTLRDLFIHLVDHFPNFRSQLFDADNNLRQDVPIFVNGRNPRLNGALDAPLQPDDVISLFSPISSGKMNVEVMRNPATLKRT